VDVDLNYVGSMDKSVMEKERLEIRGILEKLFRSQDYKYDKPYSMYLEEQFELGYTTASGCTDKLKVEINYGERVPVLELKMQTFEHPFTMLGEVQSISYGYEEIMAQKVRALVSRGTARDLYDAQLFLMTERRCDAALFKKLFLFYLVLNKEDARKVTDLKIRQITKDDVKRWLVPLLRRRDYRIDLEEMRAPVLEFMNELLDFSEDERRFLDRFYDERVFDQGLLFGDISVKNDMARHPMVEWRMGSGMDVNL
jgi:predicted nucleotidyltransferase component of viral defense system